MIAPSLPPKNEPIPLLVRVRDVAALLSISRQTVHHLIDSGDLQASEINSTRKARRHLRITRKSLSGFYKRRFGHSLNRALTYPFEP